MCPETRESLYMKCSTEKLLKQLQSKPNNVCLPHSLAPRCLQKGNKAIVCFAYDPAARQENVHKYKIMVIRRIESRLVNYYHIFCIIWKKKVQSTLMHARIFAETVWDVLQNSCLTHERAGLCIEHNTRQSS